MSSLMSSKWMVVAALALAAGAAAGLMASGWLRPGGGGSDLPEPLAALQQHLVAAGIDARGSPARAGARERLRHNARFEIRGHPRDFSVQWFETRDAATRHLQLLQRYTASAASMSNGELVLTLVDWPVDDPVMQKLRVAFASFPAPGRAP